MDIKQSWGIISIFLGIISLLWSVMSLNGIIGQEHIFTEIGSFIHLASSDLYNHTYAENMSTADRHKNFIILLTGISMASIGSLLIRGCYRK